MFVSAAAVRTCSSGMPHETISENSVTRREELRRKIKNASTHMSSKRLHKINYKRISSWHIKL